MEKFVGYLLLGSLDISRRPTSYRGVYRCGPETDFPQEGTREFEVLSRLASASYEDSGYELFIKEYKDAKDLQAEYEKLGQTYEIIECTLAANSMLPPEAPSGSVLGYDVADLGTWSPLFECGNFESKQIRAGEEKQPFDAIEFVIDSFFKDKVNEYGLFSRYEDALLFLEVFQYLEGLHANLFGDEIFDCKVFLIRLV